MNREQNKYRQPQVSHPPPSTPTLAEMTAAHDDYFDQLESQDDEPEHQDGAYEQQSDPFTFASVRSSNRRTQDTSTGRIVAAGSPTDAAKPEPELWVFDGRSPDTDKCALPSEEQFNDMPFGYGAPKSDAAPGGESDDILRDIPASMSSKRVRIKLGTSAMQSHYATEDSALTGTAYSAPQTRSSTNTGALRPTTESYVPSGLNPAGRKRKASQLLDIQETSEAETSVQSQRVDESQATVDVVQRLSGRTINSAAAPASLRNAASPYPNAGAALAALRRQRWHGPPKVFTEQEINQMAADFYGAAIDCTGFLDKVNESGAQSRTGRYGLRLLDGSIDSTNLWEACYNLADTIRRLHTPAEGTWLQSRIDPTNLRGNTSERLWSAAVRADLICKALLRCKKLVEDAVDQPENLEHLLVLAPQHALKSRLSNMKLNDNKAKRTRPTSKRTPRNGSLKRRRSHVTDDDSDTVTRAPMKTRSAKARETKESTNEDIGKVSDYTEQKPRRSLRNVKTVHSPLLQLGQTNNLSTPMSLPEYLNDNPFGNPLGEQPMPYSAQLQTTNTPSSFGFDFNTSTTPNSAGPQLMPTMFTPDFLTPQHRLLENNYGLFQQADPNPGILNNSGGYGTHAPQSFHNPQPTSAEIDPSTLNTPLYWDETSGGFQVDDQFSQTQRNDGNAPDDEYNDSQFGNDNSFLGN